MNISLDPAIHDLIFIGGPFAVGGFLVAAAFIRRLVISGATYRDALAERDAWRKLAEREGRLIERYIRTRARNHAQAG